MTSSRFAVAVHLLTLMGSASNELVKSEAAALSVNTNPVVIRRILCALAKARLVNSQAGACGGSRLARRPDQITLLQVYEAVEPREFFGLHQAPNRNCPIGCSIQTVLEKVFDKVDLAVEQVLGGIT